MVRILVAQRVVLPPGNGVMKANIERLYRLLIRAASSLQSPFLLAVRLYWGWQFAQTGWGKLGNLDHVTQFFTSLGISAPGIMAP